MELDRLIAECIKKNPKAERELYYTYAKKVFGICRRYTQDNGKAQDYMQESMAKIFAHLKRYDSDKSAFTTWISSITVYTILNDQSKKRIEFSSKEFSEVIGSIQIEPLDNELREEIAYGISAEDLLTAIRKLPSDSRNVVNLSVFESWKHADIAALLGIEISTSRSKLTRAKQQLKKILSSKLTKQKS